MISTSQDILYVTVSVCVSLFTIFLVWIMYYIVQISRQSNEMITDFRNKIEELDASMADLKAKVEDSINQVATVLDVVKAFTGGRGKRAKKD